MTVTDALPSGVNVKSVVPSKGTVTRSTSPVTVAIGTLNSGETESIEIDVVPTLTGTISNTASVQGNQPDPSPSNNTSTYALTVAPSPLPLVVTFVKPVVGLSAINALIVGFDIPLDPAQAHNPINYAIYAADRYGRFSIPVAIKPVAYDSSALTLTFVPTKPFKLGTLYQLQINGQGSAGVTDLIGNLLVGNTAAGPSGPYYQNFSRGYVPHAVTRHNRAPAVTLSSVATKSTRAVR